MGLKELNKFLGDVNKLFADENYKKIKVALKNVAEKSKDKVIVERAIIASESILEMEKLTKRMYEDLKSHPYNFTNENLVKIYGCSASRLDFEFIYVGYSTLKRIGDQIMNPKKKEDYYGLHTELLDAKVDKNSFKACEKLLQPFVHDNSLYAASMELDNLKENGVQEIDLVKKLNPEGVPQKENKPSEVTTNSVPEKPVVEVKDDERLKNIENLLFGVEETYNPIYHFNSKEYKAMMKAMIAVVEYKNVGVAAVDKKVLDALLKNVADKAEAYVREKGANPTTPLGKQRLKMALQAVYSVDPDRAKKLIDENTDRRIKDINRIESMLSGLFGKNKKFTTKENFQGGIKLSEIEKDIYKSYSPEKAKDRLDERLKEVDNIINAPNATRDDFNCAKYLAIRGVRQYIDKTNEVIPMNEASLNKKTIEIYDSRAFKNVCAQMASTNKFETKGEEKKTDLEAFAKAAAEEILNAKNEEMAKAIDQDLDTNAEMASSNKLETEGANENKNLDAFAKAAAEELLNSKNEEMAKVFDNVL